MSFKFRRPLRWRTLRCYCRMAQINHGPCEQCQRLITSGDLYDGHVMVRGKCLRVAKFHVYCPQDWFDDEIKRDKADDVRSELAKSLSHAA